jgi:peptidoglycan/xylan/chitin deacetylase (PgdA/CDA1 family)
VLLMTSTPDSRRAAYLRLHDVLVHASLPERERIMAAVLHWSGRVLQPGGPRRPMLAAEVRALSQVPGLAIGAHTVNHLALPDQPANVQAREVSECRAALAALTGQPIDLFAYPYGACDVDSASGIRRAFDWGLSCDTHPLGDSFDAARVPRMEIKRLPIQAFAEAINSYFTAALPPSVARSTRLPE